MAKKKAKAIKKELEITIRYPKTIADIHLSTVMKIDAVTRSEKLSDITKMFTVVSLFTKTSVEKLSGLPIKAIKNLYNIAMNMVLNPPDMPFQRKITVNGKEFGFIPDIDSIEGSEFIDIDTLSNDGFANYNKMLAILYRPIIAEANGRYTLRSYMKESNDEKVERERWFIKHMTYADARSGLAFFLTFNLMSKN